MMAASSQELFLMPLDLDTFDGSERFMSGTRLGANFSQGFRAYLRADYHQAIESFKAALLAAYLAGEPRTQIQSRERAIIYLYIGNAHVFQENWEGAQREYLEAVQTDPKLAEAHYNLGVAFAAQSRLDRAIAAFKESLDHNPRLYEAHFALGRCYQRLDDAGRAYIHYDQACNARPQAAEPRYYMGLMHQSHGAHELAQRCFTEALRVEPTFVTPALTDTDLVSRNDDEVVAWYYRLSRDLKSQGYEDDAERLYRALLQWRPDEHMARFLLANLLARTRRMDDAEQMYRSIPHDAPVYVDAQIRLSVIHRLSGDVRTAYETLRACARTHPRAGVLFFTMGKLLYDLEKIPASARAFERAIELLPANAQAHYLLGFVYNLLGHESWALAAWRKAVALDPKAQSVRYDLGYMYIRRGRYDLAHQEFSRVLQDWPEDLETSFMLGVCHKELGDIGRAIPLFEQVLKRDPRHLQALYYLGAAYLQIGNAALGKAHLRRYDYLAAQQQGAISAAQRRQVRERRLASLR